MTYTVSGGMLNPITPSLKCAKCYSYSLDLTFLLLVVQGVRFFTGHSVYSITIVISLLLNW